jgi:hypothetical protein
MVCPAEPPPQLQPAPEQSQFPLSATDSSDPILGVEDIDADALDFVFLGISRAVASDGHFNDIHFLQLPWSGAPPGIFFTATFISLHRQGAFPFSI